MQTYIFFGLPNIYNLESEIENHEEKDAVVEQFQNFGNYWSLIALIIHKMDVGSGWAIVHPVFDSFRVQAED